MKKNRYLELIRGYAIVGVLIALVVLFSILSDRFLTAGNLFNIARQVAMLGISSVGMACVILTAGIDLSVGSVMGIINIVAALLMTRMGVPILPAILISLLIAIAIGTINGVLVAYVRVPALIATLGSMAILRGLSYILCDGLPVWGLPEGFKTIGHGYVGPVPIPVIIMIIIFIVGWIFLNWTRTGRYIYGLGGNIEAVRLCGVPTAKVQVLVFIISAFLTGIAAVIMLSRINSGRPNLGSGYELDVITAVVLGGISITGGRGSIFGVFIGVLIIGVLANGMILLDISEYYQQVIRGAVLLMAVISDTAVKRNKA